MYDRCMTNTPKSKSRVAERVTVNLAQPASTALENAVKTTGQTKTEVINKALQLFADVMAAQDAGGALWIQESKDSEMIRTRFS